MIDLRKAQQALQECGDLILPALDTSKHPRTISPGDWILLKIWKECSPKDQLTPKWKGSLSGSPHYTHCNQATRYTVLGAFIENKTFLP